MCLCIYVCIYMCVCMCLCMYVCMYVCTYAFAQYHFHTCTLILWIAASLGKLHMLQRTHVCTRNACLCASMFLCEYACVYMRTYAVSVSVSKHVCRCIYVCMYVCSCVYIACAHFMYAYI